VVADECVGRAIAGQGVGGDKHSNREEEDEGSTEGKIVGGTKSVIQRKMKVTGGSGNNPICKTGPSGEGWLSQTKEKVHMCIFCPKRVVWGVEKRERTATAQYCGGTAVGSKMTSASQGGKGGNNARKPESSTRKKFTWDK